jgi:signal transduction histidine kinase/putative methionine-R-sulfoxide reductase with GAF domain
MNMSDPFSAIPDLLFVLSRDGVCLDYRAPHPDWSPMRPEQFLGKNIRETMPGDVAEALTASLARVLRDSAGQVEALEYPLPVAGETRYFESRLTAFGRDRVLVIVRDITARKKMEADLRAQGRLFEQLVAVARATTEQIALQATLQNALGVAMALTGAAYGDLILLDGSGAVTHRILPTGPASAQERETYVAGIMDKGLAGWVARHRQAALVRDTLNDDRWFTSPDRRYRFRSALAAPILGGPALLGVLTLVHPEPDQFNAQHLRLMQAAADEMALAVRNAELFEEQRRMAQRQTTLYQVLRAMSGLHPPDTIARLAVEAIVQHAGWPHAAVVIPNEEHTHWSVSAASGYLTSAAGMMHPIDRGIAGRAFKTRQTQSVPDVQADPDYVAGNPRTRSELVAPLCRGDAISGVLAIDSDRVAAFTEDDMALAESLADAIALALDNAHLYAQTQRHAADISALYAITRTTSRSLALEEVLEQALSSAIALLGFSAGLIALAEPDEARHEQSTSSLRLAAVRGLSADLIERFRREGLPGTLTAYVHQHRESLVIRDSQQELPPELGEAARQMMSLGYRAFAGIPLLHLGQSLGVMSLVAREPRSSTAYDLALLATIGQQIAGAIANARLFQSILDGHSRSQALINSSRDGIILVGTSGHILIMNAPALQLLRLPGQPQEWLGRSLRDVWPMLRIFAPAALRAAIAEARRIRQDNTRAGGGEMEVPPHTVHWVSLPVLTGTVLQGWLVVLYNVTDERAVERLREDITHTMVHDLRNPLGSISSALEMIVEGMLGEVPPDQRDVLQIAQHSAHRMLGLVSAILDVSRLESGRMPIEWRAFGLADLVSEVLEAQSALAHEKGIRLENSVSSELPSAWADSNMIARVLQNLVGNAIKFTPSGGVVSVAARRAEQAPQAKLVVLVRDTGPGIPLEIQPRLFQKFVSGGQLERGSGLGLAFCKLAIEAHGERIWVESVPGQGATFTFSLAVARPNA